MAPGRVARWYEMHLADELGVRPEVDRCVECDRMLEATDTFRWVPPLGGVLCQREAGPPADRAGLSLEALKLLKAYQRMDVEALAAAARAAGGRARGRGGDARLRPDRPRARRPLARLPRRGPDPETGPAQGIIARSRGGDLMRYLLCYAREMPRSPGLVVEVRQIATM